MQCDSKEYAIDFLLLNSVAQSTEKKQICQHLDAQAWNIIMMWKNCLNMRVSAEKLTKNYTVLNGHHVTVILSVQICKMFTTNRGWKSGTWGPCQVLSYILIPLSFSMLWSCSKRLVAKLQTQAAHSHSKCQSWNQLITRNVSLRVLILGLPKNKILQQICGYKFTTLPTPSNYIHYFM